MKLKPRRNHKQIKNDEKNGEKMFRVSIIAFIRREREEYRRAINSDK